MNLLHHLLVQTKPSKYPTWRTINHLNHQIKAQTIQVVSLQRKWKLWTKYFFIQSGELFQYFLSNLIFSISLQTFILPPHEPSNPPNEPFITTEKIPISQNYEPFELQEQTAMNPNRTPEPASSSASPSRSYRVLRTIRINPRILDGE